MSETKQVTTKETHATPATKTTHEGGASPGTPSVTTKETAPSKETTTKETTTKKP